MKRDLKKSYSFVLCVSIGLLLGGCNTAPKSTYYWGNYQEQVHQYFTSSDIDSTQQIIELEKNTQQAESSGHPLPPGYHAHLGMLYANAGKDDQSVQEYQAEKKLFPESATFMDYLLGKLKPSQN
ncbi:DUF4810 domain-containing protein [Glaciimonas soli]|uniref:DUF4810 domain-containing protein n=1 Tax=Glaciimonas soli TaxID=2590999 RepID=A0A843YZ70_9BURK|nr:DUF4810 domain-containing protein [Glaciimonas soli]MQR02778.1 DUF4810 domain-containing protein [Glaciimonas soli]